jgi:hypothetical protein
VSSKVHRTDRFFWGGASKVSVSGFFKEKEKEGMTHALTMTSFCPNVRYTMLVCHDSHHTQGVVMHQKLIPMCVIVIGHIIY